MWMWANRRRRLGWVVVAIAVVLIPVAAQLYPRMHAALCTWDASGQYRLEQIDNEKSNSYIDLNLSQKGKNLNGNANAVAGKAPEDEGTVQGSIDNTDLKLEIRWRSGPVGVYVGSIDPNNGSLHGNGSAYDKETRVNTANWTTEHLFACKMH